MSKLVETVDSLENKISKLLHKYEILKRQNRELEESLEIEKQNNQQLIVKISSLENQTQTLKAANAMLGSNEYKRETKLKINSLIREIDQCIVQLSE
ncbi:MULTISPECIES: hypothetical protein [Mesonia]|uniref:Cell division protein ZapB n=1 Tax=Mesonia mobilis TaxID=369791 RepID=A0ABQ3BVA8_9FLAO|nr:MULTISPECIES: hypothetical protein [Mesonia]MBQ0736828.1 hypothetical protein [Aquimarina celericrescens]GGZ58919.1 hypothetical protein GCM10008088_20630 [Mesonia mobilis]HIB37397.1 hypothetical protein [Mesonia sp.]HIO27093.1 hypothetical protein [Flavobacteriaceae bacterium]|tara:strand:- start:191 stop:481 length:291 start_codon:yes stop_codon:yes gene_type:complete